MFDLLWMICAFVGAFSLAFSACFVGWALLIDRRRSNAFKRFERAREGDFHA